MIKNLQFHLLVFLTLHCLITAYIIKPPSSFQRTLVLFPTSSFNRLKEKRTWGRNGKSLIYNNFNKMSEEDISSSILDVPSAPQSAASNIPLEQGNYRQGKIYKSYQYFISYIMNTSLWREYSLSLSMKPVVTKAFSSMIGYFLGDILAQVIFRKGGFNFTRLLRMGAFGGLFHGPTGHLFYGLLERKFPGASTSAVVKKVTVDQLVWCPLFTVALFTFTGITAGFSPREIFSIFKISGPQAILSSWLIWPAAHAVNFRVVPGRQRLLYINMIQLFFNAILSALANSTI